MMHGRKKIQKAELTEEQKQEKRNKLDKIKQLNTKLIALRLKKDLDLARLDTTEKAALLSPDWTTLWNYRREILTHFFEQEVKEEEQDLECGKEEQPEKEGEKEQEEQKAVESLETRRTALQVKKYQLMLAEMQILNKILKISPKSYTLWYQRQWIIEHAVKLEGELPESQNKQILLQEMKLCFMMLTRDERNFHCWNYRSWLIERELEQKKCEAGSEEEKKILNRELAYSTELINKNFSNFSAWFYKSKFLHRIHPEGLSTDLIQEELKVLKSAYFTEPKDQSPWQYHKWLIAQLLPVTVNRISLQVEKVKVENEMEAMITLSDYILSSQGTRFEGSKGDKKVEIIMSGEKEGERYSKCFKLKLETKTQSFKLKAERLQGLNKKHKFSGGVINFSQQQFFNEFDPKLKQILREEIGSITELLELEGNLEYAMKRKAELIYQYLLYCELDGSLYQDGMKLIEKLEQEVNPKYGPFYRALGEKLRKVFEV